DIHRLIFEPGFSTAAKVTEVSGRGVGMDVVRRNIESLRGRVDIRTERGQGTTFLVRLPLTLAVLDGLLVRVGSERCVLPAAAVRESLRPKPEHVHCVQGQPRMVQVRESVLPLVSLGAVLAGTMRAPLTGVVFALELTHDVNMLLPLLVAVTVSHSFTVLTLKRSILTEKISRRGYHLSQEYSIDPLEIIFAREVVREAAPDVLADARAAGAVAHADEPLRIIAYRMAERGLTRLPVVTSDGSTMGVIELADLLTARSRVLDAEQRRERILGTRTQLRAIAALFGGDRRRSA
ncbi:MAG TPA: chloride channel protein, partial [Vicinamibacterales bacterium]|nr:chloride channel protein [Vicinamibacterales bacterium]